MNTIGPEQLLGQIREMSQSLNAPKSIASEGSQASFGNLLKTTLDSVNQVQSEAGKMKADWLTQTSDASVAEVMIASQKADLSFRAVAEVRNKLVQAYQDIMNMPV